MKTVLILCLIITLVIGASIPEDAQATITKYENTNDGTGNYYFEYETSNGIKRTEKGTLLKVGQPDAYIEIEGRVSFKDSNGKDVFFAYIANKNGYQKIPNVLIDRSQFGALIGGGGIGK